MQRTRKEAEKKVVRIWVFGGASPCDWLEGFFAYFWLASIFLSERNMPKKKCFFVRVFWGFSLSRSKNRLWGCISETAGFLLAWFEAN